MLVVIEQFVSLAEQIEIKGCSLRWQGEEKGPGGTDAHSAIPFRPRSIYIHFLDVTRLCLCYPLTDVERPLSLDDLSLANVVFYREGKSRVYYFHDNYIHLLCHDIRSGPL